MLIVCLVWGGSESSVSRQREKWERVQNECAYTQLIRV